MRITSSMLCRVDSSNVLRFDVQRRSISPVSAISHLNASRVAAHAVHLAKTPPVPADNLPAATRIIILLTSDQANLPEDA